MSMMDRPLSMSGSPAAVEGGNNNKRKADENTGGSAAQTRAKRNRYISIAWYVALLFMVFILRFFCGNRSCTCWKVIVDRGRTETSAEELRILL